MKRTQKTRRNTLRHHQGWWDGECRQCKLNKESKLRIYRSTRNGEDLGNYLEPQKEYSNMYVLGKNLISEKEKYYQLHKSTKCSNSVWSSLKQIGKRRNDPKY